MKSELTHEQVGELLIKINNLLKQHLEYGDEAVGVLFTLAIKIGQKTMQPEQFVQLFMDLLGVSAGIPLNQVPVYNTETGKNINSGGGKDIN